MKILIITHSEILPINAVTIDLAKQGHELVWRRPAIGEELPTDGRFGPIDAAISFGGPQFVTEIDEHTWMQKEVDWVRKHVEQGRHFLGLCLGAQILAHAFGGRIWRYDDMTSEIGVYKVTPNQSGVAEDFLKKAELFYQWHLEGFDCPDGCVSLASSDLFPQQAFRYGERSYGLQFHPEITADMIRNWTTHVSAVKPEMFERPQAQQPEDHLPAWEPEADRIAKWRWDFLEKWLAV